MKKINIKNILAVLVLLLFVGVVVVFAKNNNNVHRTSPIEKVKQTFSGKTSRVAWDFDMQAKVWKPSGNPPECPQLELESPVDVSKVTSVLYPGQFRGEDGGYRVHGGFRFDKNKDTKIDVRAPFDAYVFRGSRYLVNGNLQYVFDFVNSCGIMYRLGHLYVLTPQMQKLADKFPQPKEGDSRDHWTQALEIKKGELLATEVGIPGNVFVDWGVYDLRKENEASKNADYRKQHGWFSHLSFHGICWLDYLSQEEQLVVKSLPGGDGKMGKYSDYCK